MGLAAANLVWMLASAYTLAGAASAAYLLSGAIRRIDPLAADAPLHVKAALTPGLIALWPLMLAKAADKKPDPERDESPAP
jgi:hypothetical protein